MTPPDPRLLVPASALPFVPEGARVWDLDDLVGGHGIYLPPRPAAPRLVARVAWTLGAVLEAPLQLAVDVSAPELRDGLQTRPDVKTSLLQMLHPEATGIDRSSFKANRWWISGPAGILLYLVTVDDEMAYRRHVVQNWPSLNGLNRDETGRALLGAAVVEKYEAIRLAEEGA